MLEQTLARSVARITCVTQNPGFVVPVLGFPCPDGATEFQVIGERVGSSSGSAERPRSGCEAQTQGEGWSGRGGVPPQEGNWVHLVPAAVRGGSQAVQSAAPVVVRLRHQ